MIRPLRWWFHRHSPALSGQVGGKFGDFYERCACDAVRRDGRGWWRPYPWPAGTPREALAAKQQMDAQLVELQERLRRVGRELNGGQQ